MRDSQVAVTGERELAYTDIGEPGWPCVLFFHGAPSSRLRLAYLEPQFLAGKVRVVSPKLPAPDSRLYAEEEIAPFLTAARAEAFRQGVAGYAQDVFIQGRPWPFDPSAIAAPVQLLHGELDTLVPLAHSRHTSALIPGATLRVLAGHGHFTILGELPTMASALARS